MFALPPPPARPNALQRGALKAANFFLKAAGRAPMVWSGYGGQASSYGGYAASVVPLSGAWPWGGVPGSNRDYAEEVGALWLNSAVMACIQWMQRTFPEADLRVTNRKTGEPVPNHPLTRLLERPNPYFSGDRFWQSILIDWVANGNAYIIKARGSGGAGRPLELWHVHYWHMRAVWDAETYIKAYEYRIDNKVVVYEPKDVIHLRFGSDPYNDRYGYSPLLTGVREISTDNRISTYSDAIVRNGGSPSVMLSPKDPAVTLSAEARAEAEAIYGKFQNGGQGRPLIPNVALDVSKIAFSPQEMAITELGYRPEERICALLGISPMVIGLSSGSGHRTYENVGQAERAAVEQNLIPTQEAFAEELDVQVLPDLGNPETETCTWDRSKVRALQEDQDALHARARADFMARGIDLNEFRAETGRQPYPGGDGVFYPKPGAPAAGAGEPEHLTPEPALPALPVESAGDRPGAALRNGAGRR